MAKVFTDRTANVLVDVARQYGNKQPVAPTPNQPAGERVIFRNDSGETIPPYACIRVDDAEEDVTTKRYVVVAKKPNSTVGPFLFNGPREVESAKYGSAQLGPVVRAKFATGTPAAGEIWGPKSTWAVEAGGDDAIEVYGGIKSDLILGTSKVPKPVLFPLTFTQTGGTDTYPADWTYTVKNAITDEELDTVVNPTASPHQHKRPAMKILKATSGIGYLNASDDLVILSCNEVGNFGEC